MFFGDCQYSQPIHPKFPRTVYSFAGFCARGKDGEGGCDGDSGGPAIWVDHKDENKEYLIGIYSAGSPSCGKEEPIQPNLFAAIPGKVGKWIYEKIKNYLVCD